MSAVPARLAGLPVVGRRHRACTRATGFDFLPFTEQPSAIWHTTSLTESLRGLGFWLTYTELDFDACAVPAFSNVGPLFFDRAGGGRLAAAARAGRGGLPARPPPPLRALPAAMAIAGALIMAAGFPEGAPLRPAHHRALRGRAVDPVPADHLQGGPAGDDRDRGADRDGRPTCRWRRAPRPAPRAVGAVAAAVVLALAAWPLVSGRAVDERIEFEYPPQLGARRSGPRPHPARGHPLAGAAGQPVRLPRLGRRHRPGVLPAHRRPVGGRGSWCPFSDPRANDLLWTVDSLVEEGRAFPGQLQPLARPDGCGRGDRAVRLRPRPGRQRPPGRRRARPRRRRPRPADAGLRSRPRRAGLALLARRLGPAARAAPVRGAEDARTCGCSRATRPRWSTARSRGRRPRRLRRAARATARCSTPRTRAPRSCGGWPLTARTS